MRPQSSPIGEDLCLTAEELIVFAAGHDLDPPPGVLPVVQSLAEAQDRSRLFALAARMLVSRGISVMPLAEEEEPSVAEMLIRGVCAPAGRVVISSGNAEHLQTIAFSLGTSFTVIQAWNELDMHALHGTDNGDVLAAILAAARLDEIGDTEDSLQVTVRRDELAQASADGTTGIEALVNRSVEHQELNPDAKAMLIASLHGTSMGTITMVNPMDGIEDNATIVSWFGASSGGAWIATDEPTNSSGDDVLRFKLMGRERIRADFAARLQTVGVTA
jgi:hypothetical protein